MRMATQRERDRRREREAPAPAAGPELEPAVDASELERRAAASADAVVAQPAGIEIAIRTTTSRTAEVVRVVVTPDTSVGEIMDEACSRLEVAERARYLLVANGEILADGDRPIGELVGETEATRIEMRLVRKPEAGGAFASGAPN